jgi:hypothetical protein
VAQHSTAQQGAISMLAACTMLAAKHGTAWHSITKHSTTRLLTVMVGRRLHMGQPDKPYTRTRTTRPHMKKMWVLQDTKTILHTHLC